MERIPQMAHVAHFMLILSSWCWEKTLTHSKVSCIIFTVCLYRRWSFLSIHFSVKCSLVKYRKQEPVLLVSSQFPFSLFPTRVSWDCIFKLLSLFMVRITISVFASSYAPLLTTSFENRKEPEVEAGQRRSPGWNWTVPPAEGEGVQGQGSCGGSS